MKPSHKMERGGEYMCGGTQLASFSTIQKHWRFCWTFCLGYQSSYKYQEESNSPPPQIWHIGVKTKGGDSQCTMEFPYMPGKTSHDRMLSILKLLFFFLLMKVKNGEIILLGDSTYKLEGQSGLWWTAVIFEKYVRAWTMATDFGLIS